MRAPKIHAWARQDIAKLRGMGIEPTVDEIVWLARLAESAHTPPGRESLKALGAPVKFCGAVFYPFHLRARYWVAEWHDAFAGNDTMQDGLYLYAHAHSKPGDTSLRELSTMDDVQAAVDQWLRVQEFDARDLPTICEALYKADHDEDEMIDAPPESGKAKKTEKHTRYATLEERVAELCETFEGTTPAFWTSEVSAIEADKLAAAKNESAGDSGAWAKCPMRQKRVANYMNAVKWIVRNHDGA